MRVVVLGAGVVGVAAARRLRLDGHEVTLLDEAGEAANPLGSSHANAGQLSYSYSAPWAAPGVPLKALGWLLERHGPFRLDPRVLRDPRTRSWLLAFLRECRPERWSSNRSSLLSLASLSREALEHWRRGLPGLRFDEGKGGTLEVVEGDRALSALRDGLPALERAGIPFEFIDGAEGLLRHEPGLAGSRRPLSGGLRMPLDGTGDARAFAAGLLEAARSEGVRVLFRHRASHAIVHGGRAVGVVAEDIDAGRRDADLPAEAVVVCLGARSPLFLAGHGIELPVVPVAGFSLTAPAADPESAPRSTVMHETLKVATTRLGDRVRVGGTAALRGFRRDIPPSRIQALLASARELFPRGADWEARGEWTGHRPMTPDGRPRIGETRIRGLWTCAGHGTLGWTLACGTAELLSALVSRRTAPIDPAPFSP